MIKTISVKVAALLIVLSITACGGSGGGTTAVSPTSGTTNNKAGITATLTWDAPTTRIDNSSLNPATDLQSYTIYYGVTPGVHNQSFPVSNPGTATVTSTLSVGPGTYYFVVTATDNYGQESGPTPEISKTF